MKKYILYIASYCANIPLSGRQKAEDNRRIHQGFTFYNPKPNIENQDVKEQKCIQLKIN